MIERQTCGCPGGAGARDGGLFLFRPRLRPGRGSAVEVEEEVGATGAGAAATTAGGKTKLAAGLTSGTEGTAAVNGCAAEEEGDLDSASKVGEERTGCLGGTATSNGERGFPAPTGTDRVGMGTDAATTGPT